jgi:hypothetical protein
MHYLRNKQFVVTVFTDNPSIDPLLLVTSKFDRHVFYKGQNCIVQWSEGTPHSRLMVVSLITNMFDIYITT